MSEREEYTPPMEVLHDIYCGIFEPINPDLKRSSEQFNRAIAAHDRALREEITREVRADMLRGVRAWVKRFSPGDRWDPQDAIDLESALHGTVEANPDRSRARGEGSE